MAYNIEEIPGTPEKRVFISGNYDFLASLREIEKSVKQIGFQPIVPIDFEMPKEKIVDYDVRLLHGCNYAIFDVTAPSGAAYMELALATRELQGPVLAVYQTGWHEEMPPRISSMLTSTGVQTSGYSTFAELGGIVNKFLK